MAAFNLTAEINLRGPSNLNQVVGNIKRQLSTVSLNLNINPSTSGAIRSITSDVRDLSTALRDAQTSAASLNTILSRLGSNTSSITAIASALGSVNTNISNVGTASNNAANNVRRVASEMEEFGRQSALAIRRFAAFSVATGAVYALSRAITSAYGEFLTFNQEFVKLQQVTDSSAQGLKSLSSEITRLSTSLGVQSQELLKVSLTLAQAGLSATETKVALEALAKSALAPSFGNLNETVEGSIALMRQFGISSKDLESSLGSINAVAARFAVEAEDIIAAIQRTGGVFAAASKGVSEGKEALNEFIAVFTSVRATTRESAETIATGLRTIFTRIQRGSTIEALREYGVELTDLQGKFVGPYEAVRRLSAGLAALDSRDLRFSKIVEELGGFRQIGKVIPLIQQFQTAQEALGVAQKGSGSLAGDAATAQQALAVRITKVREEFIALIRDIGQSQGFQKFVDISLRLASALITVADAAKNVLPALAAIAAIRGVGAVGQFFSGFAGGIGGRRGGARGFASGGLVPGQGDGDTVPAMLTPGEFVIRKKAVESIGVNNLHKINKYASGGLVQKFAQRGGGSYDSGRVKPLTAAQEEELRVLEALERQGSLFGGQKRTLDILRQKKGSSSFFESQKSSGNLEKSSRKEPPKVFGLAALFGQNYNPAPVTAPKSKQKVVLKSGIMPKSESLRYQEIMVEGFKQTILKVGSKLSQGIGASIDTSEGKLDSIIKNTGIGNIIGSALEGSLGVAGAPFVIKTRENQSIDFPAGLGGVSSKFGLPSNIPTDATRTAGGKGKTYNDFLGQVDRFLLKTRGVATLASGGAISGEDNVPALLTPGEFVINKKAAQRIGAAQLNKLNNADKIKGYNTGGFVGNVQSFAGGGFVDTVANMFRNLAQAMSGFMTKIALWQRGIPSTGPSSGGWVGGGTAPLSSSGIGVTNRPSRLRRMATDPMMLMFGATMAGDGIGRAIGGPTGAAVSGGVSSLAATAGIAAALAPMTRNLSAATRGFLGITAAGVSLVAAIDGWNQSLREALTDANNKKIETESEALEKSFEKLGKQAVITAEDLSNIGKGINNIVGAEASNRQLAIDNANGGMLGWMSRRFGATGEMFGFNGPEGSKINEAQLSTQLFDISKTSASFVTRAIEQSLDKGLKMDQIMGNLQKDSGLDLSELQRAIAISQRGREITDIEAKIAAAEGDQGLDAGARESQIEALRISLDEAVTRANREFIDQKNAEAALAAQTKAATNSLDIFAASMQKFGGAVERAMIKFSSADRELDLLSSGLGKTKFAGTDRRNENVFNNLGAYSEEEVSAAITSLSSSAGFDPKFTEQLSSSILTLRTIETGLPKILLDAQKAQDDPTSDPKFLDNAVRKLFEDNNDIIGASPDALDDVIEQVVTELRTLTGGRQAKTFSEIASSAPLLGKLMENVNSTRGIASETQKKYNDALDTTIRRLEEFSNIISRIDEIRLSAQERQTNANNDLRAALGQEISLTDSNMAFENTIRTLTNIPDSKGVIQQPTLDPDEIARRLEDARKELSTVNDSKPAAADKAAVDAWTDRMTKARSTVDRLASAQEKLANDTSRASNALERIREQAQLQNQRQNQFFDFAGNANNPEWMFKLVQNIQSYQRISSGGGSIRDIAGAIEAFNRRQSVLPAQQAAQERVDFGKELMRILTRGGNFNQQQIDALLKGFGLDGPNDQMKDLMTAYNKAVEDQTKAMNNMAGMMSKSGDEFYRIVQKAAMDFAIEVAKASKEAAQQPPPAAPAGPAGAPAAGGLSSGGVVYASSGKFINFEPKGTDTVPAMLTPGEFVVNAKATSKNFKLLQAINNGHSKGYIQKDLSYFADGGPVYDMRGREIITDDPERVRREQNDKALRMFLAAKEQSETGDSIDFAYDWLESQNIDRNSEIAEFIMNYANTQYDRNIERLATDPSQTAAFSPRDIEIATAVREKRARDEARQKAAEQAILDQKRQAERMSTAYAIGQQLASSTDRPKDLKGFIFRTADGRFEQMGDIADINLDNEGKVASVVLKKVGGAEEGSLTRVIPIGLLDNASQIAISSYYTQQDKERDRSFREGGALTLDDVASMTDAQEKKAQDEERTKAFEVELDRLSRRVTLENEPYTIPSINIIPGYKAPNVPEMMGKVDPALDPSSRLGAWARARDLAVETLGEEQGLWEGNDRLRTFGVKRLLYEELIREGIIGNDQRQTESVDDARLREIVNRVVNQERSIIQSRVRDSRALQRGKDNNSQTERVLGYVGEGLYNGTPTRSIGEFGYGVGETVVGGFQGVLAASAFGITGVGLLGSMAVDAITGSRLPTGEMGSERTEMIAGAAQSMLQNAGASFGTVGTGLDRVGRSLTFDMETMNDSAKESALAKQERERAAALSNKSLGSVRLGENLILRAPSPREIYVGAGIARDTALGEIAGAGASGVLGFADDAARATRTVSRQASTPLTSADDIARVQTQLAEATSPLGQARARMARYIRSGRTGEEVVGIPQGGQLLRSDAEALGLLRQADETPIFQPEVVRNAGADRVRQLNPDRAAQATAELRAATRGDDGLSTWMPFPQPPKFRPPKVVGNMLRPQDRSRWAEFKDIPWVREQRLIRAKNRAIEGWLSETRFGQWVESLGTKKPPKPPKPVSLPESFGMPDDSRISLEGTRGMDYDSAKEVLNKWRQKQAEVAARRAENAVTPETPPVVEETVKPPLRVTPQQTAEREALLAQRKAELAARRAERAQGRVVKNMPEESYDDDVFRLGEDPWEEDERAVVIAVDDGEEVGRFFDDISDRSDSSIFDPEANLAARQARLSARSDELRGLQQRLGIDKARPADFREGFFGRRLRSRERARQLADKRIEEQLLYDAKKSIFGNYSDDIEFGSSSADQSRETAERVANMSALQQRTAAKFGRMVRDLSGGYYGDKDITTDLLRFGANNVDWIDDPSKAKQVIKDHVASLRKQGSKVTDAGGVYIRPKAGGRRTLATKEKAALHENVHMFEDMVGETGHNFDDLRSRAGANLDKFLDTEYNAIARASGNRTYDAKYIRETKSKEFMSVMMQAMESKKGKALIEDSKYAKDIMRNYFQSYSYGYADGGVVYAHTGKLIPMTPKGTDTVPAMLTPGEFVVNAKAAKQNMGLLHAINNGAKGYSSGGVTYLASGGVADKDSNSYQLEQLTIKKARLQARLEDLSSQETRIKTLRNTFNIGTEDILAHGAVGHDGSNLPDIIDQLGNGPLEITGDMIRSQYDSTLKDFISSLSDNGRKQLETLMEGFSFEDLGIDIEAEKVRSLKDIRVLPRLDYLELLQSQRGDIRSLDAGSSGNGASVMTGMGSISTPQEVIDFFDSIRKQGTLAKLPKIYQEELPKLYDMATQLLSFASSRKINETDIPTYFDDAKQKLNDQIALIDADMKQFQTNAGPTRQPAAAPTGIQLGGVNVGGVVGAVAQLFNAGAGIAAAAEQKQVEDAAKKMLSDIPSPDYYDEITYKEYIQKLIDQKPPVAPVPPERDRFITPARYIKTTDPDTGKTSTSRVTGIDTREKGKRTDAALADAKIAIIGKVQELEQTRQELLPQLTDNYPVEDPLKTKVDTFLTAANLLIEEAKAKGLEQQGAPEYNYDNMLIQSLENSVFGLETAKPNERDPLELGVEDAMVGVAVERSKDGTTTGVKSAQSQYNDAVKWYIVQRGRFNYEANNRDKATAYKQMMADRRQAYVDGKEARRQAYLDPNRGRVRQMSTGGVVYAQKGMLIPYQPRGTDTVPAMLTPGEFVINRESAQKHMGLLRAINNGQTIKPKLYNKGGLVNVEYHANNPNVGSPSSSSMPSISLDSSSFDSSISVFDSAISNLSGIFGQFAQSVSGLSDLSSALNNLGSLSGLDLAGPAGSLSNAAQSVQNATNTLTGGMIAFNSTAAQLASALQSMPRSIDMKWSGGSIPVTGSIVITIEGSNGISADQLASIGDEITNRVGTLVKNATDGGIDITAQA